VTKVRGLRFHCVNTRQNYPFNAPATFMEMLVQKLTPADQAFGTSTGGSNPKDSTALWQHDSQRTTPTRTRGRTQSRINLAFCRQR
jgi:hypothetical protein